MIRYILAAQALRLFSINGQTMGLYRKLGNAVGGRSRAKAIEPHYVKRADANLAFIESLGAIRDGMTLLELGTGWVHWESLFTRLFYDVRIYLFDVWDNRQFDGFVQYARHLRNKLYEDVDRPKEQLDKAAALLDRILACKDFDEVYGLLGFTYVMDPTGSLKAIPDGTLDLVISSDVLEHVDRAALPHLVADLDRAMKPGAICAAQIVEEDHLGIYDRTVHPKNYLRYSDTQWRLLFENKVQYINRLQHSDFTRLFGERFDVVRDEIVASAPDLPFAIAEPFRAYDERDLKAYVTRIAAQRRA